jgi:heterodisulfide reductase subunit B
MKLEWATESYTVCCTRNERSQLAWFKTGTWKQRGNRKESKKGKYHLCREEKDAIHILLKCSEMKKWIGWFVGLEARQLLRLFAPI